MNSLAFRRIDGVTLASMWYLLGCLMAVAFAIVGGELILATGPLVGLIAWGLVAVIAAIPCRWLYRRVSDDY